MHSYFCFRPISPHMVNIHQFYPEIDFSLDKGTVGEIVVTPKSTSRSDMGKRSAVDLKDTVIEEEGSETESQAQRHSPEKPEDTPFVSVFDFLPQLNHFADCKFNRNVKLKVKINESLMICN